MHICIFAFVIRKSYLCLEIFEQRYTQIATIIPLVITLDNYRNLAEWNGNDEWQRQQDKYFGRKTFSWQRLQMI